MKKFRCKIGIHRYKLIKEQQISISIVNSMTGAPLTRNIKICHYCGNIKYTSYDINFKSSFLYDDDIFWKPKVNLDLEYRKIKIDELRKRIKKIK